MAEHLHKCLSCEKYTFMNTCPSCRRPAALSRPPSFSLDDKYGELKRKVKREALKEKGWY